ncbi:MAG: cell division FtsA domain-containing protein [Lachnospiraceae bacterium]
MEANKYPGQVVFGLDIGTRSIVGTVGYQSGEQFIVLAQTVREHQTRAMLDGQIHDIGQVGATITEVKEELEKQLGMTLHDVCIAAAGRVLKTVNVRADIAYEEDHDINKEDIYGLETLGVEKAYQRFTEENQTDVRFYCVGYTVVRYYLNDYPIGNLEDHKARKIGADLIATFLPDDVVDGLYKAVEIAGLSVANLTLEPIAAIQVAIPPMYRMLNIALVDVGAGTSDISITKDGSIVAYGMIPVAGDSLTEAIAGHCLVDFETAEHIKRGVSTEESVAFTDIMGLPQVITREEVYAVTKPLVETMAKQVSDKIKELNGDKPVSAVFIVGGGGKINGYDEALAVEMGIVKERVALRGEEVMQKIQFMQPEIRKDSLLVTPVGICLSFYAQNNNFIYVTFNHKRVKLYDNSRLAVVDAALQADFPNSGLFPKRGQELRFMLNGKERTVRGGLGETAVIKVNGNACDITAPIHANDVIEVTESTAGEPAQCTIGKLPEYHTSIEIIVNGTKLSLPKYALVNGELKSEYYEIRQDDHVEITNYYTVEQLLQFLDLTENSVTVMVNNLPAQPDTKVYENFTVAWQAAELEEDAEPEEGEETEGSQEPETVALDKENADDSESFGDSAAQKQNVSEQENDASTIMVIANGKPVTLSGKKEYIYVDIFDYIDFDLTQPKGKSVVTLLNGAKAGYVDILKNGDQIEIYWEQ